MSNPLKRSRDLKLTVFTNSVCAYNEEDRKSITGGVVNMGRSPTFFIINQRGTYCIRNDNTRSNISRITIRWIVCKRAKETKYHL